MKLNALILVILFLQPLCAFAEIPFPEPGHEGLKVTRLGNFEGFDISLWLQYRIMYNNSNTPGPGGTTFTDTKTYDFFRQRFRIGIDIKPAKNVGAYTQLEYRGGWGGSSPQESDPRGSAPTVNPFNRLQSRGLRYGFVYANLNDALNISAGILPLTDRVGRTLFDADWDFNVGGVVFGGRIGQGEYRLSYVRLVEGVGGESRQIGKDSDFILADYNMPIDRSLEIGGHIYGLNVPQALDVLGTKSQTWYGLTAGGKIGEAALNGMVLINHGKIGNQSHTGNAIKLEANIPLRKGTQVSTQILTATGDEQGKTDKRFTTLHGLFGTEGFWGYTHIFTANGPSDVNDLGLEIGNNGAGLTTIQAKVDFRLLVNRLNGQLFGGWFQANRERNDSKNMGSELGGMLTCHLAENLNWELGAAFASLGDFYAQDADNLQEIYSRLQLTR